MKCSDEVCFYFGVALVNGEEARLEPFDYTGKKVVLHSQCKELAKEEAQQEKVLFANYSPCVISQRSDGVVCLKKSCTESFRCRKEKRTCS